MEDQPLVYNYPDQRHMASYLKTAMEPHQDYKTWMQYNYAAWEYENEFLGMLRITLPEA